MQMPSNKNLDGTEASKKGRLQVKWNKNMTFDGRIAIFSGGVQAQELSEKGEKLPSWLLCRELCTVHSARTLSVCDGPDMWTTGPTQPGTSALRSECSPTPSIVRRQGPLRSGGKPEAGSPAE